VDFDLAAHSFERSVLKRAPASRSLQHIGLELTYNRFDLFYRAEIFYGFAFLASLVFMMAEKRVIRLTALALVLLAFIPHTAGLVSRMLIMGRPPVTNLYATFIFVSWICVALGLVLEGFQRNALGLLLSSVAGLVLLMVSGRFSAQGDTLGVMIAVLDSNFWLSTHVVSITIGYAGCVAAGVAGHIYLLKALRHEPDSPALKSAARAVYGLLAFGLIFSFLGTMLGGVWADQSWGRFWGWDPKENGALLIVLWCSLLFHARISKMIGPRGMAAGSVLGVIVVLMAWLGINLLGVGLHSYGFTSGLARGLWISVAAEILFVVLTAPFAQKGPAAQAHS
jgi:ABC-type transport system involved in cytochrome c biogenesis permease subunit